MFLVVLVGLAFAGEVWFSERRDMLTFYRATGANASRGSVCERRAARE